MLANDIEDIDCVFEDRVTTNQLNENKFYMNCTLQRAIPVFISIDDVVKVRLEDNNESIGYGQVLALYEDAEDFGVMEVRWYQNSHEVLNVMKKKRKLWRLNSNELFESEDVDDIPVGAVLDVIDVCAEDAYDGSTNQYICKQLYSRKLNNLIPVSPHNRLHRGYSYSRYTDIYAKASTHKHIYTVDSMSEVDQYSTSSGEQGDRSGALEQYSVAIGRLHLSVVPKDLPGRESETSRILEILREIITKEVNSYPLYISGLPGKFSTGKTATVLSCIDTLFNETLDSGNRVVNSNISRAPLPRFEFLEINCLRLNSASDAYIILWKHLSGEIGNISVKTARIKLNRYFDERAALSKEDPLVANTPMTIVLVDEIDYMNTSRGSVMYDFIGWPLKNNAKIFIIGVANTMDLLEQQVARSSSRVPVGMKLRLVFKPYDYKQIGDILCARLCTFVGSILDEQSIELTARKAANAGGDVRRALRICQRILEILRDEIRNCIANNTMGKVIVNHSGRVTGTQGDVSSSVMTLNKAECFKMVTRACSEYLTNPTISTIQRACLLDRAILVSFYKYLITISDSSLKFLTGYDLYIRLADLLKQIQLKQATSHANQHIAGTSTNGGSLQSYGIHLLFPPWNIFKLAIQRLLTQGLVSIHMIDGSHFHHSNHRMIGYSEAMQHPLDMLQSLVLSVVIDTNDIKTALRTSEFAPFL